MVCSPHTAPKRGESVEATPEHEGFMAKLREYHEKRGTTLDSAPKVGVRHIDLYKLYQRVVSEGGYDLCSDTKAKPLMWRRFAEEFVGKNQYTPAQAFQIKNVYYKNLCAYEISNHWQKDPPPKEILEEVTAKGGNVMGRTMENFVKPPTREEKEQAAEGSEHGTSPEQKTPKAESATLDGEDPNSAAGNRTRGLRQAPPQRVLFQPELSSSRQTRGAAHVNQSPTPGQQAPGSNSFVSNSSFAAASATLANYEPPSSYPLTLKPVTTPANNPDHYRNALKRKAEATMTPLARKYRHIMLPGTGFIGPNIYVRAQMALQSGVESEEEYALHHLVKISHERGDKYRFDQFPGLAEALVKKVLQVSSLFWDIEWDISYDDDMADFYDDETLNGLSGTSDAIQKLKSRLPLVTTDTVTDARWNANLERVIEAGLVIRNMCLQNENAQYLARQPMVRDYLAIALNLPPHPSIVELQHYALDTAEQILVWVGDMGPDDAVYVSLLELLEKSEDRGAIMTALRTVARIGMHLPDPKRLDGISKEILGRVGAWLMVDDEEMKTACLDFLFQFTSFADNVEILLQNADSEAMARQLSRLLLFAAKEERSGRPSTGQQPAEDKTSGFIPKLSRSVVEALLKIEEPERSSEWLRMCFLPSKESEMTQISLWQSYQSTFSPYQSHLIAGDFIKNVSTTFVGATAQVAGQNKYVIRGIRARKAPIDTGMLPGSGAGDKGKEMKKCCWRLTVASEVHRDPITGVQSGPSTREIECGEWFRHSNEMLKHILKEHMQIPRKPSDDRMDVDTSSWPSRPGSAMANGTPSAQGTPVPPSTQKPGNENLADIFEFAAADKAVHRCRWASCKRTSADPSFAPPSTANVPRTALFARHIQTHIPNSSSDASQSEHNVSTPSATLTAAATQSSLPKSIEKITFRTFEDEKGDAAGVPLGAALVLRNIAKFMPKSLEQDRETPAEGILGQSSSKSLSLNGEGKKTTMGKHGDEEEEDEGKGEEMRGAVGPMERIFDDEVLTRLFFALTHGRPIGAYVGSVLRSIARSSS
ncbi:hypothetical protein D0861_06414 [Hortaea werneckii]|uniref:ARID domain-containing protein n=1 Tax=Hortaea werneckii TaxID=91943 RepID=A0A3M7FA58_HORWE|nr:hypothetical protein D0861_06414 [Hortaea werneckii]